jgi:hypothetical protein
MKRVESTAKNNTSFACLVRESANDATHVRARIEENAFVIVENDLAETFDQRDVDRLVQYVFPMYG